jgi:peptidoglycan-associated lipoprotein
MFKHRSFNPARFLAFGAALFLVLSVSTACGKKQARNPVSLAGTSAFGPGGAGSGSGAGAWGPGGAPGAGFGDGAGFGSSLMGGAGNGMGDGTGMMNNANTAGVDGAMMIADLEMVHFEYDSDTLTPEWMEVLDRNAGWLIQNVAVNVQVEGHTDERGTEEYNIALGQRRADAVREYLVAKGIVPERISTISYGKMRPLTFEFTDEGHSLNRRAMFLVYSPETAGTQTAGTF